MGFSVHSFLHFCLMDLQVTVKLNDFATEP